MFLLPPPGLGAFSLLPSHGLRRGLHPFAASRLAAAVSIDPSFPTGGS